MNTTKKTIVAALALIALAVSPSQAEPTVQLAAGATTVTFAPSFLDAANTLGVGIQRVSPAWIGSRGGATIAWFPTALGGASIDLETAKAEILHTGGLRLTAGDTVVRLTNYAIDTTGAVPVLTGLVSANGSIVARAPLFTLTLPALTLPLTIPKNRIFRLPSVGVKLTPEAAVLLNSVFGVTAFAGGLEIGTASVAAFAH